jgi:hypothetical protein
MNAGDDVATDGDEPLDLNVELFEGSSHCCTNRRAPATPRNDPVA